ncbi:MAG: type III-A CRISPR-associated RAMP protein Csm3 [Deltaproteobacteria bacterium]|nr:type III-A CRISPR-associated RAMP protein Csm3 [Deltaproteobacteria bacterium]
MKLVEIKEYRGKIKLMTGLHIGAGDVEMHIGGTDNPVVKHPFTFEPYIPGSSLKGKVRSLLELRSGLVAKSDGKPLSIKVVEASDGSSRTYGEAIIKLFGTSGAEEERLAHYGPSRLSFSDCMLTDGCREQAKNGEIVLTEIKSENSINRIKGTAENPRFTERVPAGVEFAFHITMKVFDRDDPEALEAKLLEGLKLLEYDALGGNGSRGYGRVKFSFDDEGLEKKFRSLELFKGSGK